MTVISRQGYQMMSPLCLKKLFFNLPFPVTKKAKKMFSSPSSSFVLHEHKKFLAENRNWPLIKHVIHHQKPKSVIYTSDSYMDMVYEKYKLQIIHMHLGAFMLGSFLCCQRIISSSFENVRCTYFHYKYQVINLQPNFKLLLSFYMEIHLRPVCHYITERLNFNMSIGLN